MDSASAARRLDTSASIAAANGSPAITEAEFESLAQQGYNRIPLIAQLFADLESPLSLYLKLAHAKDGGKHSFLLESVVSGERMGRYSFIGLPARTFLRVQNFGLHTRSEVVADGTVVETSNENPLSFIAGYLKRFNVALPPDLPRFCGGLAGYFAYDAARYIERKLEHAFPPDSLGCPDILLLQCEELAVIDNVSRTLHLIVYADPAQPDAYAVASERLGELRRHLHQPVRMPPSRRSERHPEEREFPKADYLAAVERAKEFIAAGDLMQIEVGQRIRKRYTESPVNLYRALRALNPSPYMYYYNFGDFHVVGASPEILVRQENTPQGHKVVIRPLAGTRPRGATPNLDQAAEQELSSDPKERAEHLMLIDLARNDIGRIAKTGSVKVTEAFAVERYSHVMHLVSHVEGLLEDGMTNIDVLRAAFPAGTLTGAPKVHAMELIDQLEPTRRGLYGGACGYLSFAGDMDMAIAIRTGIVKDNTLYVQAAAGIVADSIPEQEWRETEAKARALLRASELVEDGLDWRPIVPEPRTLAERYSEVRKATIALCSPLSIEDYVVQSMPDASPVKWHLAHTSWFFEEFVLQRADAGYDFHDADFRFLFNSYYNAVGPMHTRSSRGMLSRPTVQQVLDYRRSVDERMSELLQDSSQLPTELSSLITLGLHHEQQHQELMITDIKHLFSCNPLLPAYAEKTTLSSRAAPPLTFRTFEGGLAEVGHGGGEFCFDNELPRHRVYLAPFALATRPVTNGEYLEFIRDDGYRNAVNWLSDGWTTVQREGWTRPIYWSDSLEKEFTLRGLIPLDPHAPVVHLSFYEADAFARWAGARLPSEFEWELAASEAAVPTSGNFIESGLWHPIAAAHPTLASWDLTSPAPMLQMFGDVWEWTQSAYSPYPGYRPAAGALGEYNGKFMVNQLVLRGGSCATPGSHIRATYRNFFNPAARWQFSGVRLARDL